jgi:hypothetical protein
MDTYLHVGNKRQDKCLKCLEPVGSRCFEFCSEQFEFFLCEPCGTALQEKLDDAFRKVILDHIKNIDTDKLGT